MQWHQFRRSAARATASRGLKFSQHVDDMSGECSVAKPALYGAKRARGTSRKTALPHCLKHMKYSEWNIQKTAKIAEHECNPGRISRVDLSQADMGTTQFCYSIQLSLRKFWFDSTHESQMVLQKLIQISSRLKMDFGNLIQIDSRLKKVPGYFHSTQLKTQKHFP